MNERLTPNFWLSELVATNHRTIANVPSGQALVNLRQVLAPGLQQIRDLLKTPLLISSGYRSPELNTAVGGQTSSQHILGLAADFTSPDYGTPMVVCRAIQASSIQFDQLIHEYGRWAHVSFSATPRRQVLTIDAKGTRRGLA